MWGRWRWLPALAATTLALCLLAACGSNDTAKEQQHQRELRQAQEQGRRQERLRERVRHLQRQLHQKTTTQGPTQR
jgi:CHASE1-domain containing sensor protein